VSAFQKAGLISFCPTIVYNKLVEFSTPAQCITLESESELELEIDWLSCITPACNMKSIGAYSDYIDKRLQANITEGVDLTPSVGRAIKKRQKAMNIIVLDGITAKEDLFKKEAEEKEKVSSYLNLQMM
jgi:hypothetical protein